MQEMQFDDLQTMKATQIYLLDYGVFSESDDYNLVMTYEDGVFFQDEDWDYIDFIACLLGSELEMGHDIEFYRNFLIESLDIILLDDMIDFWSLCYLSPGQGLLKYYDNLPKLDGFYDVFIHCNGVYFTTPNVMYSPEDFARVIEQDSRWDKQHEGIRLMACRAGCGDAHIRVGQYLNCVVRAPVGKVASSKKYMKYWVVLDEWFPEGAKEEQIQTQLAYMIKHEDYRLEDSYQENLWVEYHPDV